MLTLIMSSRLPYNLPGLTYFTLFIALSINCQANPLPQMFPSFIRVYSVVELTAVRMTPRTTQGAFLCFCVCNLFLFVCFVLLVFQESTLKSLLSALWNLSAHSIDNKVAICSVDGALGFLVSTLTYRCQTNSLAIIESGGGILRNVSSLVATREDYR